MPLSYAVLAACLIALALAVGFLRLRGYIHSNEWTAHHNINRPSHLDHPISGNRKVRRVTYHPCGCRTANTMGSNRLVWLRNCDAHLAESLRGTCYRGDGEVA